MVNKLPARQYPYCKGNEWPVNMAIHNGQPPLSYAEAI